MANEITAQHAKALDLHNRIMVSAQLVQTNLWDMCSGLKEMRDGKLYKELGYQNFEEYCGTEFNISRRNAYYYISIIENMSEENVKTFSQIGKSKLYLLSTLSEPDQQKITAENDVQSMTVKELEQQIKELKDINEHLEENIEDRDHELRKVKGTLKDIDDQNIELRNEINELRSRPIDVAVAEPSEDVRQLKQTIKSLEISTEQQMKQMERISASCMRRTASKLRSSSTRRRRSMKKSSVRRLNRRHWQRPLL